ncbi:tegument protein UL14 [Equid gammaherpesvirus 5]|uniref:Tegument protein UL14 n=1 Tax=Equid gammaherpesvirus 5 TaxID=10371 RepID=A0A0B4Q616_9GAMA|nr:tegument protein UL14 [Equid gammaherpesvirus 5]AIU39560.1 tegument protein UL14 [Equid gammaherpesvirus 5]APT43428.1 tegument protein UL14 [Equid gammaherpesvirus 5]UTK45441.1 tegument protein UL14 [Equid gammaherpesvirus 5]
MATASGKDQQRDLIARGLEAEVNKRTSVSLFDRFGPASPIFKKQYGDTRLSVKTFNSCSQRERVRASLEFVQQTLECKVQERRLLKRLDRRVVAEAEKLCEAVTELREDFEFDLENLEGAQDDAGAGNAVYDDVADTITEWRAETLPSVPAETTL